MLPNGSCHRDPPTPEQLPHLGSSSKLPQLAQKSPPQTRTTPTFRRVPLRETWTTLCHLRCARLTLSHPLHPQIVTTTDFLLIVLDVDNSVSVHALDVRERISALGYPEHIQVRGKFTKVARWRRGLRWGPVIRGHTGVTGIGLSG